LPWPFHVARTGAPWGAFCAAALSSAAARAACSAAVSVAVMVVHPLAVRGQLAPGAPVWGAVRQVQRIVTLGYARLRKELEQSRQPAPSMAAALGISTSTSPQARAAAPRSPLQKTSTS